MFQLLGVEVTKAQLSFDTTVISRVQKVGSIVPLESRIYAVWSLNIEGGNILYNSVYHGRRKYERCSPNSLRPKSYFGSIWELHVLDLKTKVFCWK